MKNQSECEALAGADGRDAVPDGGWRPAPGRLHRPLARRSGVSKLFLSDTRARKPQDRYNDVFCARLQLKFLADGIAGAALLARSLQSR